MEYFRRSEFTCQCGCGFNVVDFELGIVLDDVREHFNSAVIINSGCRCKPHNKSIGGSDKSQHCVGKAADIRVIGVGADVVYEYLNNKYPNKYGIGRYVGRTHIDVRNFKARWDNR